jgi:mannose-1-phosphate guanylyltransferase
MAGGVGERFWPQSRRKRPKQLLDLTGRGSMISLTVDRVAGLSKPDDVYIVTNVEQEDAVRREVSGRVPSQNIVAEPRGQNTAPCIGLAAMLLEERSGDRPMLVLPADHLVEPVSRFETLVRSAVKYVAENRCLLTFGVRPTRPDTGYGYIEAGEVVSENAGAQIRRAKAFLEKPDAARAREFVEAGHFYWNSGMFLWTTRTILDEIATHLPRLADVLGQIRDRMGTRELPEVLKSLYHKAPSISIDYGIMEKASRVVVMEADFAWNDVGSWEFIRDIHQADEAGNVSIGDHVLVDAHNNTIVSPDRLVGLLGVDDVVVVDGGDTILVCKRDRVQEVKAIVRSLRDRGKQDFV